MGASKFYLSPHVSTDSNRNTSRQPAAVPNKLLYLDKGALMATGSQWPPQNSHTQQRSDGTTAAYSGQTW